MSALFGYGWLDHTAYWAWVAGVWMGAFCGVLLGQWMERLTRRNPLGIVIRAYRELFADIAHLCATGQLRPGRLARRERAPAEKGGGFRRVRVRS